MVLPMASTPLPPVVDTRQREASKPLRVLVPAPAATASTSSPASGLAEEVAALEQARRALAVGDSDTAMVTLEHHARKFPSSQLDHEAAVLRVEALIAARRCGVARAEATAFLQSHPRSPAARRMESLVAVGCAE
jgi:TolA-binding protein